MAGLLEPWREILAQYKPRRIRGASWFRAVLRSRRRSILGMDGAFLYGGRYNPAEVFGALYLSESAEGCAAEISRRPGAPDNYLVGEIEVNLGKVCDLTDAGLLQAMGLTEDHLKADDWIETQVLGELVREAGFEGMIVPSAAGDFQNLVIFMDRLSPESSVQLGLVKPLLRS